MGSSYLPPLEQNVVNVGDELSQSALDAINAAASPSSSNPFVTASEIAGAGQPGPAGPAGPAGPTWVLTGTYDNGRTYSLYDVVEFYGSSYVLSSYIGAAGYDPGAYPSYWQLIASAGQTGPMGNQGIQGDPGPQGDPGTPGTNGTNGAAWNVTGAFDWGRTYQPNDVVEYQGSSYVMYNYAGSSGYQPDSYTQYWQLIAAKGSNGNDGANGSNGSDGSQGPQGDPGPQGPPGVNAFTWRGAYDYYTYYYANDVISYDGSSFVCIGSNSYNWPYEGSPYWQLLARKGDAGPQGPQGDPGSGGGSNPPYYYSIWIYGGWYEATPRNIYDAWGNYINVLSF